MEIISEKVSNRQKRYSDSEKRALLQSWKISGLNRREFCRQIKISISSFYKWMKYLVEPQQDIATKKLTIKDWLPIQVIPETVTPIISIKLPNGIEIKFSENAATQKVSNLIKELTS